MSDEWDQLIAEAEAKDQQLISATAAAVPDEGKKRDATDDNEAALIYHMELEKNVNAEVAFEHYMERLAKIDAKAAVNKNKKDQRSTPDSNSAMDPELYISDGRQWVGDRALSRLFYYLLAKPDQRRRKNGTTPKEMGFTWGYPMHWKQVQEIIDGFGPSIKQVMTSPGLYFHAINIRCSGKNVNYTGNHWVALMIDTRPYAKETCDAKTPDGVVYYWDPKGVPLPHAELRASIKARFPTLAYHDVNEYVQDDTYECGIWTMLCFSLFYSWAIRSPRPARRFSIINDYPVMCPTAQTRFYNLNSAMTCSQTHRYANAAHIAIARGLYKSRIETYNKEEEEKAIGWDSLFQ